MKIIIVPTSVLASIAIGLGEAGATTPAYDAPLLCDWETARALAGQTADVVVSVYGAMPPGAQPPWRSRETIVLDLATGDPCNLRIYAPAGVIPLSRPPANDSEVRDVADARRPYRPTGARVDFDDLLADPPTTTVPRLTSAGDVVTQVPDSPTKTGPYGPAGPDLVITNTPPSILPALGDAGAPLPPGALDSAGWIRGRKPPPPPPPPPAATPAATPPQAQKAGATSTAPPPPDPDAAAFDVNPNVTRWLPLLRSGSPQQNKEFLALALAVMDAESAGNPNARSSTGPQGLMQIGQATAIDHGVDPKQRMDPAKNIYAGTRQLDRCIKYASRVTRHTALVDTMSVAIYAYHDGIEATKQQRTSVAAQKEARHVHSLYPKYLAYMRNH